MCECETTKFNEKSETIKAVTSVQKLIATAAKFTFEMSPSCVCDFWLRKAVKPKVVSAKAETASDNVPRTANTLSPVLCPCLPIDYIA